MLVHNLSSTCFEKTPLSVAVYLKDQFGNDWWSFSDSLLESMTG